MRKAKSFAWVRPFIPVIVGLSLGFSMSLVRMPLSTKNCQDVISDHVDRQLRSIDPMNGGGIDQGSLIGDPVRSMEKSDNMNAEVPKYDSFEDFEPRIITDPGLKPKIDLNANKKKIVRTRFISTELGMREKLYVATITTKETIQNLAVAFNKTFAHHMQKLEFYVGSNTGDTSKFPKHMLVRAVRDGSAVNVIVETLKQIYNNFRDEYDWFFISRDDVYVEGERLNALVNKISINRRLYMGLPMQVDINTKTLSYCSLKNGVLMSRMLFIELAPGLQKCSDELDVDDPSHWLGYCIHKTFKGAIKCASHEEDQDFYTYDLPGKDFDPEQESTPRFKRAMTVANLKTPPMFYKLHRRFSQLEIEIARKEIEAIQEEIKFINSKLPQSERAESWPIGINPQFKPTNRWDIIVWDYFTEEYTLTCPGEVPKCALSGIDKLDVQNILQTAMERLNEKYNPQKVMLEKKKLINGYRRFDPQRGMEYTLDLLLTAMIGGENDEIEISHRVHLLRPLSQVEIIPMPYVTEATKVEIILHISAGQTKNFDAFIKSYATTCLDTGENVGLSIVFVYDPADAQRIREDDVFGDIKRKLQEYEVKYQKSKASANKLIPWVSIKTEVPSQLKTMDVVAKKHNTDSLFFLTSANAVMNLEFLNRCRMNAVQGWQAFFPVPFSQYNSDIIYKDKSAPKDIEIKPSLGHFDLYSFDEACFYNSDYMAARNKLSSYVAGGGGHAANEDPMDTLDVYKLLVQHTELHVFRAVEPELKRRYVHRVCNQRSGEDLFQKCERSNAEGLASRSQLAMELYPEDSEKKL